MHDPNSPFIGKIYDNVSYFPILSDRICVYLLLLTDDNVYNVFIDLLINYNVEYLQFSSFFAVTVAISNIEC